MWDKHEITADIDLMFWQHWQEHQDYLYRCCLKWMGGNSTEAEDALSMTMLKAREKVLNNPKTIQNFKAWLAKLTYNLCMDIQRQRDRVSGLEVSRHAVGTKDVDSIAPLAETASQGQNPILAA